jgi:hypothetical protein
MTMVTDKSDTNSETLPAEYVPIRSELHERISAPSFRLSVEQAAALAQFMAQWLVEYDCTTGANADLQFAFFEHCMKHRNTQSAPSAAGRGQAPRVLH